MPIALAGVARENAAPTKSWTDSAPSSNSIEQAWTEYRRHRTDSSRSRIITHYMRGHVRRIAERMRAKLPGQVEVDDLAQQGYMGLVDAIDRFDEDRGVKFETFSSRRIHGAMQDLPPGHRPRATTHAQSLQAGDGGDRRFPESSTGAPGRR